MNSIIINFHNITNLKIIWNSFGDPEKIEFTSESEKLVPLPEKIKTIISILDNYYNSPKYKISEILPLKRFSEFQRKVYTELSNIPMGNTISYLELSKTIGYPKSPRAIGNAMKRNVYPLIIPCHRVVGSRNIGGFTPDLKLKIELLKKEGFLL